MKLIPIFLMILLTMVSCANPEKAKIQQWEQAHQDGKLSYFELEQLKLQQEQKNATIQAGLLSSQRRTR